MDYCRYDVVPPYHWSIYREAELYCVDGPVIGLSKKAYKIWIWLCFVITGEDAIKLSKKLYSY